MQTATFEEVRPFCARLTPENQEEPGRIELFYSHSTPIPHCREAANKVLEWLGEGNLDRYTAVRHTQASRRHGHTLRKTVIKYRSFPEISIAPHEMLYYELHELVQPQCGYIGNAEVELVDASAAAHPAYRFTIRRQVWETKMQKFADVIFDEQRAHSFLGSVEYTFLHPWTADDGQHSPEGALLVAERYMRVIDAFPLNGITVRT